MPKDLRFTLYDAFGYLMPGAIALAALTVLLWAIYLPAAPLAAPHLGVEEWVLIVVLGYFLGHTVQGISTAIVGRLHSPENAVAASLPTTLIAFAKEKAGKILEVEPSDVSPQILFALCDQAQAQSQTPGDREIYQYREGFYRGSTVALVLLALAIGARWAVPGGSIVLAGTATAPHWSLYSLLI